MNVITYVPFAFGSVINAVHGPRSEPGSEQPNGSGDPSHDASGPTEPQDAGGVSSPKHAAISPALKKRNELPIQ
jgi:hypothetical protein